MKNILITGAAGAMGLALIRELLADDVAIFALDLSKETLNLNFSGEKKVQSFDLEDFRANRIPVDNTDCIIHCAFARSQKGAALSSSIDFTREIFETAVANKVPVVINISSQSVYGNFRSQASSELDQVDPFDQYGIAKYACEKIGELIFRNTSSTLISVRMASLVGLAYSERIINKMALFALKNRKIRIVGGSQLFSFLHLDDAVRGLRCLMENAGKAKYSVYNLGTSETFGICQLADTIAAKVREKCGFEVAIEVEEQDVKHSTPLEVSRMKEDFNWSAKLTLDDTVNEVIEHILRQGI